MGGSDLNVIFGFMGLIRWLQEKDKTKKLQEALLNRKRSSRLQLRELEKLEMDRQDELRRMQEEEERRRRQQEQKRLREEMVHSLR